MQEDNNPSFIVYPPRATVRSAVISALVFVTIIGGILFFYILRNTAALSPILIFGLVIALRLSSAWRLTHTSLACENGVLTYRTGLKSQQIQLRSLTRAKSIDVLHLPGAELLRLDLKDITGTSVTLHLEDFSPTDRRTIAKALDFFIRRPTVERNFSQRLSEQIWPDYTGPQVKGWRNHMSHGLGMLGKTFLHIFLPAILLTGIALAWAYITHQPIFR